MDLEGIKDLLIPLVAVLTLPAVFCAAFYFRYRTRRDLQLTLRTAIEKGQELTPETLKLLGGPQASKNQDLRRGILTSASGLALIVFSLLHTTISEDGGPGVRATGALVMVIGFAFLILWRLNRGSQR